MDRRKRSASKQRPRSGAAQRARFADGVHDFSKKALIGNIVASPRIAGALNFWCEYYRPY